MSTGSDGLNFAIADEGNNRLNNNYGSLSSTFTPRTTTWNNLQPSPHRRIFFHNNPSNNYTLVWWGWMVTNYTGKLNFAAVSDDNFDLWIHDSDFTRPDTGGATRVLRVPNWRDWGYGQYDVVKDTVYCTRVYMGEGGGGDDAVFFWNTAAGQSNNASGFGHSGGSNRESNTAWPGQNNTTEYYTYLDGTVEDTGRGNSTAWPSGGIPGLNHNLPAGDDPTDGDYALWFTTRAKAEAYIASLSSGGGGGGGGLGIIAAPLATNDRGYDTNWVISVDKWDSYRSIGYQSTLDLSGLEDATIIAGSGGFDGSYNNIDASFRTQGDASANKYNTSYPASKAFNNDISYVGGQYFKASANTNSSYQNSAILADSNTNAVKLDFLFPYPRTATEYRIYPPNQPSVYDASYMPNRWCIYGSSYETIDTTKASTEANGYFLLDSRAHVKPWTAHDASLISVNTSYKTYKIANPGLYRQYRMSILQNSGNAAGELMIGELVYYEGGVGPIAGGGALDGRSDLSGGLALNGNVSGVTGDAGGQYPYYAFDGDASNTSYIAPTGTFANNNLDETAINNSLQILPSNGSGGDIFGFSVAIDGNYALIGAYRKDSDKGSAYLYKFSEAGNGVLSIDNSLQILVSDGAVDDFLGTSVAIGGSYALVGAKGTPGGDHKGSVYLYKFSEAGNATFTIDNSLQIIASDRAQGTETDYFGYSVAIYGNYALVGAYAKDSNKGSAYLYKFSESNNGQANPSFTIDNSYRIIASDGVGGDYFGRSVDIDGSYALIGAYKKDSNKGSVYLYKFSENNATFTIDNSYRILASDGAVGDYFGVSVAIDGSYALVGANLNEVNGLSYTGSAYLYKFSESGTAGQANSSFTIDNSYRILAFDGAASDFFGISVAIDGNYALVGAKGNYLGNQNNAGSTYLYKFSESGTNASFTIDNSLQILASDGDGGDYFGSSVAINGNYLLAGAHMNDVGGDSDAGSAYLYKFGKEYAIKFEFPEKKTVTKYDVLLTDPSNLSIREWELRGCDNSGTYNRADASTYTVLDARTVDNSGAAGAAVDINHRNTIVMNPQPFNYYVLDVTKSNYPSSASISQIKYYDVGKYPCAGAGSRDGSINAVGGFLIHGDASGGGQTSASDTSFNDLGTVPDVSGYAYNAFNNKLDISNSFIGKSHNTTDRTGPWELRYTFPEAKRITHYRIWPAIDNLGNTPCIWEIRGVDFSYNYNTINAGSYNILDKRDISGEAWTPSTTSSLTWGDLSGYKEYQMMNPGYYRQYIMYITGTNNSSAGREVVIGGLAYYESDKVDVLTTREPQPYENHQLTINKGVSQETSDWEIGEILVFNKKLNADEEQSVVSYLERTFYGPDGYDPVGNNREMHLPRYNLKLSDVYSMMDPSALQIEYFHKQDYDRIIDLSSTMDLGIGDMSHAIIKTDDLRNRLLSTDASFTNMFGDKMGYEHNSIVRLSDFRGADFGGGGGGGSGEGGTETTYSSGGISYKVHTFLYDTNNQTATNSGQTSYDFTVTGTMTVDLLLIGGGGGGGVNRYGTNARGSGGGGAGGVVYNESYVIGSGNYSIVVGGGGTGADGRYNDSNVCGTRGSKSTFNSLEAGAGGGGVGHTAGSSTATGDQTLSWASGSVQWNHDGNGGSGGGAMSGQAGGSCDELTTNGPEKGGRATGVGGGHGYSGTGGGGCGTDSLGGDARDSNTQGGIGRTLNIGDGSTNVEYGRGGDGGTTSPNQPQGVQPKAEYGGGGNASVNSGRGGDGGDGLFIIRYVV